MSTLQVANVHLESTGNNRIQYAGSNTVSVYTAGVERMRIDNAGNIDTGTSSFPQLQVSGTSAPTCTFTGSITSTAVDIGGGPVLTVSAITSGTIAVGDVIYGVGVSPITKIVAQRTGTTGSTGTYEVSVYQTVSSVTMYAASGTAAKIRISDTDTQVVEGQPLGTIEFFTSDAHNGIFTGNPPPSAGVAAYMGAVSEGTNVNGSLVFGTRKSQAASGDDANERMRIDNNGNVGIGTTAPSSTLDVIGTVKFTSANVTSNTLTLGTSSITANGYSRLPNGLLYQWGSIIVNNTTAAFNWPTAFAAVYSVTATSNNIAAAAAVHVPAFTTTTCRILSGGTTVLATWMAIGI